MAPFRRLRTKLLQLTLLAVAVLSCGPDHTGLGSGDASDLEFSAQPGTIVAGTPFSASVTAKNAQGQVDPGFLGTVTVAIASGTGKAGASLGGPTSITASNGVATATGLTIDSAGTGYKLTASAPGLGSITSTAFDVQHGTPTQLAFTAQPGNTTAGQPFGATVTVRDAIGNTATSHTGNVSVAIASGSGKSGAALSGTKTVAAVAGVATLSNLTLDSAATGYRLTATGTGLSSANSSFFNISAGAASALFFTTQPTSSGVAQPFGAVVAARDAIGNSATSFSGNVSVAIAAGTGAAGAVLSGTKSVAATSGVATFGGLSVDQAGTGYRLSATGTGLTGSNSSTFDITAAAPSDPNEPADPGSGYLWADNFDRYTDALAMQWDVVECGNAHPDAQATYGQRTMGNASTGCVVPTGLSLTTGRGGSGKALRSTIVSDPNSNQQELTWLSPWRPGAWASYTGALVVNFWFRSSAGGTPAPGGTKWFEVWYAGLSGRVQIAITGDAGSEVWSVSNNGRSSAAVQPVGPYWKNVNDGNWHKFTILLRKNTTDNYPGQGSRDGVVRVWVDGTKVVDLSAAAAGVTPPGGTKVWCTLAEVDQILSFDYERTKFPDVFNGAAVGFTLDHDDLKVWRIP